MRNRCPSCGSDRFEETVIAFDRQVARRDDYLYGRCSCALVSLRPTPRDHEIPDFYPDDYPPHEAQGRLGTAREPNALERFAARHRFGAKVVRRRDVWGRFLWWASGVAVGDLINPRGDNRLLDVGCGSGRLLARHRSLGWEVRGIDPGERAVASCRLQGLPVQQAGLLEADLPSRHFDVILLHHVIEHVPRPIDALRRARDLLASGGVIVIATPNIRGLGFRLYGSCWYALDAPRHLHLFDAETLTRASENAGLSVLSLRTEASARVLAASRHYSRTQGAVLPPGLAARAAALERSREQGEGSRRFRKLIRPVASASAWLGYGETLCAELVDPGRRA